MIIELDKLLLHLEQRVRAEGYADNPFLEFERIETTNINRLDEFYRYVTEKRVREIEYTPFDSEPETRVVFPVILREFNNRWTLIAFDKTKNAYQNFAMDRIGKVRLSTETLVDGNNFDSETYFKDVIGNTIESDEVRRIVFTVLKRRAYYIETKPWHHSQRKLDEDETSMTFELHIKPNREFWAKVMEHIEDIEIIGPEDLRTEFKEKVRGVYKRLNLT